MDLLAGIFADVIEGFVGERAVFFDGEGVEACAVHVGDDELGLVGGEDDAVGKLQAGIDDAFFAAWRDVPDLAFCVIGGVDRAFARDDQIIHRRHAGGDDGFFGRVGQVEGDDAV